ncbi:MAG: hypothetical protein KDJ97_16205 [Anaerolineae bacterium]|nr:hypothetical protein [Anaerolineae bacterium]
MVRLAFYYLPPTNANEWNHLKNFVSQFNYEFNTSFQLDNLPELENRDSPQPEAILKDSHFCIAIERKIIVWPFDYFHHHSLWHSFAESICDKIGLYFDDDIYTLEINDVELPNRKFKIEETANQIADEIIKYQSNLKNDPVMVYDTEPLDWRFYKLPEYERDDEFGEPGIVFSAKVTPQVPTPEIVEQIKGQLQQKINHFFSQAVKKFADYEHFECILVLEPYVELFGAISYSEILESLTEISVPKQIDQVWLAEAIEVEDGVLIPDYNLIHKGISSKITIHQ